MPVVLVTVGSTSFDALVSAALSQEVLELLAGEGVDEVVLQVGRGKLPTQLTTGLAQVEGDEQSGRGVAPSGLSVRWFRFAPCLAPLLSRAALVVGHGGAGTVLECVSAGVPLVCATNGALLHDHQGELAERMEEEGRLARCSPHTLEGALRAHFRRQRGEKKGPPPLSPPEPRMFAAFLEDFMGLR